MTIIHRAGDHEMFAPGCFDGVIGQTVPWMVNGERLGSATLVTAQVAEDGCSAELVFETETIPHG